MLNTNVTTLFDWITEGNFDIADFFWLGNPFAISSSHDIYLAWRQDLLNVQDNPTSQGPFWNAGSWGFAQP